MSTVAEILRNKGDRVCVIEPDRSVLEAARQMNVHHIGALVVVEPADAFRRSDPPQVLGIITERDIMTRVVAAAVNPERTAVSGAMTSPVITCEPRTTLEELRHVMRQRRIRHVPVVSEHGLCGMISIGDLNVAQTHVMEETIRYLETYMYHG